MTPTRMPTARATYRSIRPSSLAPPASGSSSTRYRPIVAIMAMTIAGNAEARSPARKLLWRGGSSASTKGDGPGVVGAVVVDDVVVVVGGAVVGRVEVVVVVGAVVVDDVVVGGGAVVVVGSLMSCPRRDASRPSRRWRTGSFPSDRSRTPWRPLDRTADGRKRNRLVSFPNHTACPPARVVQTSDIGRAIWRRSRGH